MRKIEAQYYDKHSKIVVVALKQWFYNRLRTGVKAEVGKELNREFLERMSMRRRVCDLLFELLNVLLAEKIGRGRFHVDVQTRARGDELARAAGYKGTIIENEPPDELDFFVQAFIFLSPVPQGLKTVVRGYPDDFRLAVIDMSKVDGLELLAEGIPEAAVFAVLSLVVPRNLLVRGVVNVLQALTTNEEWRYWTEVVFAFVLLRKDYRDFTMELTQELERTAPNADRKQELRFIYRAFIEEGYEDGYQKGQNDGYQKGQNDGYQKGQNDGYQKGQNDGYLKGKKESLYQTALKMKQKGADIEFIAETTGLSPQEVMQL